jgi:glycerol-3-phosphate dehydrogenase (NAD(P)+)
LAITVKGMIESDAEPRIVVLGAGAWGTALALILARHGRRVTLGVRRPEQLAALRATRENAVYLPGVKLAAELDLTDKWAEAVASSSVVICAVPSRFARQAISAVAGAFRPGVALISAVKGIEEGSAKTMTQMMADFVPTDARLLALSGPGFALEVAQGMPAALVAAARDEAAARAVQRLLAVGRLRLYRSTDVTGVELGGAVKNVIAIAAGVCDGLKLGLSARAALITRGLAEITRLGVALGARPQTLSGLSGLGDLVLTCTGELSRNRAFGIRLAQDEANARRELTHTSGSIVEGVTTVRAVKALADAVKIEMPLVNAVFACLYEDRPASAMAELLLQRELKAEFY